MKKLITLLLFSAFFAQLNAAQANDVVSYESGDSMAWYHELIADAYNPSKRAATEKLLMSAVKDPKISDEAFRLSCKILKVAANEASMPQLLQLANKPNRVAPIFNILISSEYASVDKLLIDTLKKSTNKDILIHAAYALGMRDSSAQVMPLFGLAQNPDAEIGNACIIALGHIPANDSVKALMELAKNKKANPFFINNALAEIRDAFVEQGKMKEAEAIVISEDFRPGLWSMAMIQPNANARMKFLDKHMASDKLLGRYAARIANEGRTFDNSADLLKVYPKLSEGAKIAAVRNFAISGDQRFFDIIAKDVADGGSPVNLEAIYASAYIGKDAIVPTLINLMESSSKDTAAAATFALTTIKSAEADKALKAAYAKSKSVKLLNVLLNRGNADMQKELFSRMFDQSEKSRGDINRVFENQCGYGGLKTTFDMMQKADPKTRDDALKATIKFVLRDKNKKFRQMIYDDYYAKAKLTPEELELVRSRFLEGK